MKTDTKTKKINSLLPILVATFIAVMIVSALGNNLRLSLRSYANTTSSDSNTQNYTKDVLTLFADSDATYCLSPTFYNATNNVSNMFTIASCYGTLTNVSFNNTAIQTNYTKEVETYSFVGANNIASVLVGIGTYILMFVVIMFAVKLIDNKKKGK